MEYNEEYEKAKDVIITLLAIIDEVGVLDVLDEDDDISMLIEDIRYAYTD